jgi:hypothetical protein
MPVTRVYPMTAITEDVVIFDRNLQVEMRRRGPPAGNGYDGDMVVEARHIDPLLQPRMTYNYNEINIVENNFLTSSARRSRTRRGTSKRAAGRR